MNPSTEVFVLPFWVGLLLAVQVLLLTLYYKGNWTFAAAGVVTLTPSYLLFARLFFFLYQSEIRAMMDRRSLLKGKNPTPVSQMERENENSRNRIFVIKLAPLLVVVILQNLRMDLHRYTITIWVVSGIVIGLLMMFATEGLMTGRYWWADERELNKMKRQEMADELDEYDDDDGDAGV